MNLSWNKYKIPEQSVYAVYESCKEGLKAGSNKELTC